MPNKRTKKINEWDSLYCCSFFVLFIFCFNPLFSQLYSIKVDGKWGYINQKGEIVIEPAFDFVNDQVYGNSALVRKQGKYFLINLAGQLLNNDSYDDANFTFGEGCYILKRNGKYGLVDTLGKTIIPFEFDKATNFRDGIAVVKKNDKWIIFEKNGEQQTFNYPLVCNLNEKMIWLKKGDDYSIYNFEQGREIIGHLKQAGRYKHGQIVVFNGMHWGVIDKNGVYIIKPSYKHLFVWDYSPDFKENLFAGDSLYVAEYKNQWHILGFSGKRIVKVKDCDMVHMYYYNYALFTKNDLFGAIDKKGKVVVKPVFEDMEYFTEGCAAVKYNGKWGVVDSTGQLIIGCRYDILHLLKGDMIQVRSGKDDRDQKIGYINKKEELIWGPAVFKDIKENIISTFPGPLCNDTTCKFKVDVKKLQKILYLTNINVYKYVTQNYSKEIKKQQRQLIEHNYLTLRKEMFDLSASFNLETKNRLKDLFLNIDTLFLMHKEILNNLKEKGSNDPLLVGVAKNKVTPDGVIGILYVKCLTDGDKLSGLMKLEK